MKYSTRSRYGLRAMIELAKQYSKEPILLKDIAERQDISMKYLDHIITPLRVAGLINRKKGGYILSRPPSQISCMEIVNILEGSLAPVECVDNPDICERVEYCVAIDVWRELKKAQDKILDSLTLKDLVERKKSKNKDLKNGH
jgi:Rrf2 family protein